MYFIFPSSSTILQHLFTHLFICSHCSFYAYSQYELVQHLYDKHDANRINEHKFNVNNPASYDLLYLTRCTDGTFALCMDTSTSTNVNNRQRMIPSTIVHDQPNTTAMRISTTTGNVYEQSRTNDRSSSNPVIMKCRSYYADERRPCLPYLSSTTSSTDSSSIRHT
jgi:hypothetical protein